MTRLDALDAFVAVVNTAKPDHPYYDDPYPLSRDDIEYGVTRSCIARCGPRRGLYKAYYGTRLTYINKIDRVRHLAILTHEITHIPYNYKHGNQHGGHAPEFWREMTFHALEIRDAIEAGVLEPVFGPVMIDDYLQEVADNPHSSTVDRRYWSVQECRDEVRHLLGLD